MRALLAVLLLASVACTDDDPTDAPFAECPAATTQCGFADHGWNLWCDNGAVLARDLTEQLYCDASGTVVCELPTAPDAFQRTTCATATCATADVQTFFDFATYNAFDPQNLCSR